MKKLKDSFKAQAWLSIGIIIVSILVSAGVLYYFAGDLSAKADKIVSDENMIAQQTSILTILAQLKKDAPIAAQYTDAMSKLLPTHDNLIGVQQWLMTTGQDHSVAVSFLFQGENVAATPSTPGSDGFTLGVTGKASDIVDYLKDIEMKSAGYLVSIDSFDLSTSGTDYKLAAQGRVFSR